MLKSKCAILMISIILSLTVFATLAWSSGTESQIIYYFGVIDSSYGRCEMSTSFEKTMFQLNSVRNKYKVFRIQLINKGRKKLKLSKSGDKVKVIFKNDSLDGILNMADHDHAFWDSLTRDLRKALVYPKSVKEGEEENIFVFINKQDPPVEPKQFSFKIKSLNNKKFYLSIEKVTEEE